MPVIRLSIYAKRTFFKGFCANGKLLKVDFALWPCRLPGATKFEIMALNNRMVASSRS
jgi:hypothetical protein